MNNDINEQLEGQETWEIQNDSTADWFIETKQQELKEIARYKEQLEGKIFHYTNKLDKLKNEEMYVIDNMNSKLAEYFDTLNEKDMKKTKTMLQYRLPTGTLVKKLEKKDIAPDGEILLKYLKKNNMQEYIKTTECTKWGEIKKNIISKDGKYIIADTGEIVEGIIEKVTPARFEVKI